MIKLRVELIASLVVVVVLAFGCSNPTSSDNSDSASHSDVSVSAEEEAFIRLVNEHREAQGLNALTWNDALGDVAQAHSQDMRDRGFFSHTNPDGDDPFDRMDAAGISYRGAAENIASGYATGEAVLNGWLNSDGHRQNIESGNYTHHGIGYVEDGNYWTHVFATDPSVSD